jgi:hypothetical protein
MTQRIFAVDFPLDLGGTRFMQQGDPMKNLKTISLDDLDGFKVDESGNLYWGSRKVRTALALPFKLDVAAWLVAAATVVQALHTIAHWNMP